MLSPDRIRAESGARKMRNHIVKQCRANDGADNTLSRELCAVCKRTGRHLLDVTDHCGRS